MNVLMRTTAAGPMGILPAGKVVSVDDKLGESLLIAGYATAATEPPAGDFRQNPKPEPLPDAQKTAGETEPPEPGNADGEPVEGFTAEQINKAKKPELVEMCREFGLPIDGNVKQLRKRLTAII